MSNPEPEAPKIEQTEPPKEPDQRTSPPPVPVPTPPPTVDNPRAGDSEDAPGWARDLMARIQAMPEHMVNAIRESAPTKPSTDTPKPDAPVTDAKDLAPGEKPAGRSFSDKWFGR